MKTPEKNSKKQDSGATHESKANTHKTKITTGKDTNKGPWKNPDPTSPKKSPEKINEPFAGKSTIPGNTSKKSATGIKGEKITNAGESEHHIPLTRNEYESYEEEYDDFEFEEEEDNEYDEDEDGETSSNYYENEEDESKQFRSQVITPAQKKLNEQAKLNQKQTIKTPENKNKSQVNATFNQKKNNNPQA